VYPTPLRTPPPPPQFVPLPPAAPPPGLAQVVTCTHSTDYRHYLPTGPCTPWFADLTPHYTLFGGCAPHPLFLLSSFLTLPHTILGCLFCRPWFGVMDILWVGPTPITPPHPPRCLPHTPGSPSPPAPCPPPGRFS